jgi:hypothetical protein
VKRLLFLIAGALLGWMFCALTAHAGPTFEAGFGVSSSATAGNGAWYQEGLPHTLDMRHRTFMLGLTDDFAPGWAWHAQYVHLGKFSSDALAADRDEDYDAATQTCKPGCNVARYRGSGTLHGLTATIERHMTTSAGARLGVEGGLLLYPPQWSIQVDNWKPSKDAPGMTIYYKNPHDWQPGLVVGASVGMSDWGLSLRHYWDKCTPSADACLWKRTWTIMATRRF